MTTIAKPRGGSTRVKTPLELAREASKLTAADLQMFADFKIDEAVVLANHIRRVNHTEARELLCANHNGKLEGIEFPYISPKDGLRKRSRVRRDHPEMKQGKPDKKYLASTGDRQHLYFPAGELLKDWFVPVLIVESEKAALALTCWSKRTGTVILPIATGGDWGWCGTRGIHTDAKGERVAEKGPVYQLDWLKSGDRHHPITIMYDCNVDENIQVRVARNRLANELVSRGHEVKIAKTPEGEGINGPDDAIKILGDQSIVDALNQAAPLNDTRLSCLQEFNQEFAHVMDPGAVVDLETMQVMDCAKFQNALHNNRYFRTPNKKGVVETRKTAPEWMAWSERKQFQRMTYNPGQEKIIHSEHGLELNRWRGWGCEPKEGNCTPFAELMQFLFEGENGELTYFLDWLAYPLQHPGTKLATAVVLWGQLEGTGKTLVGETMFRIYRPNATEITDRELAAQFNDWALDRQFIMGSEITGGDKRGIADHLKQLITRNQVTVNQKYVPAFTVPDRSNFFFTSNHLNSFYLSEHDRRFFVWEVKARKALPKEFYDHYVNWMEGEGPAALFHYLLQRNLAGFNPKGHAPLTPDKQAMVESGRSELDEWTIQLRDDPGSVLRRDGQPLKHQLWTAADLLKQYDPKGRKPVTVVTMGNAMRKAGFRPMNDGGQVRTRTAGKVRLWAVRNQEELLDGTAGQLAEQYDTETDYGTREPDV